MQAIYMNLFNAAKRPRGAISSAPQFTKVDIKKVSLARFEHYIAQTVTESLKGVEDDVTINLVSNSLAAGSTGNELIELLTPILGQKAANTFVTDLWALLVEAAANSDGIPLAWKAPSPSSQKKSANGGIEDAVKLARAAASSLNRDVVSKKVKTNEEEMASASVKVQESVQVWFAPVK